MSQEENWYFVCQIGATKVSALCVDRDTKGISAVSFVSQRKGCAVFFESIYQAQEFLASLDVIKIGIKKYIKAQGTRNKTISKENKI
jgi:hypothetical protein